MGVLLFIIGIIIFCIGVSIGIAKNIDPIPTFICLLGFIVCLLAMYLSYSSSTPTTLDVYRGKTTLEITYRDSVAVDSVVVFKK